MNRQTFVKNNNLNISIVDLVDLSPAKIIGAEYYQPDFLIKQKLLLDKRSVPLGEIVSSPITKGETPLWQGYEYQLEGIPFVRSQNLSPVGIKGRLVFVPDEYNKKKKRSTIKYGDSLIAIVGATIGQIGLYDLEEDANCNQAVAIIRTDKFLQSYVNIFLQSLYFSFQLEREKSGNARDNIDLDQLRGLIMPIPDTTFLEAISVLVKKAHLSKKSSEVMYQEAEKLFLKEINLESYKTANENISIRSLVEATQANRFDAEYWQPKYDEVEARIKAARHATLGDVFTWKKGIEVGSEAYQEQGIPFIRISNLTAQEITDSDRKSISSELYAELKDDYAPREGEILFSKDGTVGIAHHLTKNIEGVISGGILRLTVKDKKIDPDYLTVCLNSLAIQMQVERYGGGSIIQHLKTDDAEKILIPLLNPTQQTAIADGARVARKKLSEAKALIDLAKRAVEVFIEQDEDAALRVIESA